MDQEFYKLALNIGHDALKIRDGDFTDAEASESMMEYARKLSCLINQRKRWNVDMEIIDLAKPDHPRLTKTFVE